MAEQDEQALKKGRYLKAIAKSGTLTAGCRAAKVSPHTVYQWREMDDQFVLSEHQAREEFADQLEMEAVRRAWHGTKKPVYQGGELVGYIQEFSDSLLMFTLKAVRPAKYRDNSRVEVTGKDGGAIDVDIEPTERVARRIAQLAARVGAPGVPGQPEQG